MFGYLLKTGNKIVSLLVHVFLAEAKNHVKEEEKFYELVKQLFIEFLWRTKCCIVRISKDIVA